MKHRLLVVSLAGLLVGMVAVAHGQNGTPGLGSAHTLQDGSQWFLEARTYELDGDDVAWEDNITISLGGRAPINDSAEFSLIYSRARAISNQREFGVIGGAPDVIETKREVISPSIKWRLTGPTSRPAIALTLGSDVAVSRAVTYNRDTGAWAAEDAFTPAARLQAEWGRTGALQWQLAAQLAAWDAERVNNLGATVDGFGTVAAVGGGALWPISRRLVLGADFMAPISGDNLLNEDTAELEDVVVWTAALDWNFSSFSNKRVSAFATNALGPTLGSSIIATPDNTMAVGLGLTLDF